MTDTFVENYDRADDADPIVRLLWIGGRPHPGFVKRAGFRTLVFCAAERQPSAREFPGLDILRCAIHDADGLTRDEAAKVLHCADEIKATVDEGEKVLVTCNQGANRSALLAAVALYGTREPGEIIALIRRKRRPARREGQRIRPLTNLSFVDFIMEDLPKVHALFWDAYYRRHRFVWPKGLVAVR